MARKAAKQVRGSCSLVIPSDTSEWTTAQSPQIPLEVVQHMLSVCGSLKLVKNCRLVSRSWNEISCTILKRHSVVFIEELEEQVLLDRFKQFLLERQFQVSPDVASPFQNYSVRVGPIFFGNISKFMSYPNVRVVVLDMTIYPTMSAVQFTALLSSCKPFLQQLTLKNCCEGSKLLISPDLTTGWPSLLHLTFNDDGNWKVHNFFIRFIHALLQGNPSLRKLTVTAGLENVKKCLVAKNKEALGNLRSLSVFVTRVVGDSNSSPDYLAELSTVEVPGLRELKFHALAITLKELQQMFITVISRHAQSLELLTTNFLTLQQIPKALSKLKSLRCRFDCYDSFEYTDNFQALTTLKILPKLWDIPEFGEAHQTAKPCANLKRLDLIYTRECENSGTTAIWSILGRLFPLVTQISLSFLANDSKRFPHHVLKAVGKWFPGLQALEISSETKILLLRISDLKRFTLRRWALQDVTGGCDPSLALKNLRSLKLRNNVQLDRDFIQYGLSQMKGLRSLSFPWDKTYCLPADIPAYLGSLNDIHTIVITCKSRSEMKELTTLAGDTPNVTIQVGKKDIKSYYYSV